jgi:patatin-like phospholipase/acyl hydrolase
MYVYDNNKYFVGILDIIMSQLVNFFVQAKHNDLKNARLADICIGTSAAPTFLPAHYFETKDAKGNTRSFDLIDGGVAANNPVSFFFFFK